MTPLHQLLARQIRRLGIGDGESMPSLENWKLLLTRVSNAYREADEERYLVERSLMKSSDELRQLYDALKRTSESEIQKERDKFGAVLESMGDGLYSLDAEGRLQFMNPEAARICGFSPGDFGREPVFNKLQLANSRGDVVSSLSHNFMMLATLKQAIRVEDGIFNRKIGGEFPVAYVLNPLRSDGKFAGAVLVFRDITDRKRDEMTFAAKRELERLRDIITHAPVAMAMFDLQMRYITYSAKWLTDYGLEGREVAGKSHYEIFPDIPERWKDLHRRALAGEIFSTPEDVFERESGEKIYIRWALHPWYVNDGSIGGIIMVTDRVDALVHARESAIESARIKDAFFSNMSHELRTPLNGVIGMSALLLETDLGERQREYTETIRTSAEHLLSIINDVLDYSKIEVGKLRIELAPFDLESCVEDVLDVFAEKAFRNNINIISRIDPSIPAEIVGDAFRVRQVLLNLVGNAVKFTERGAVTVEVSRRASLTLQNEILHIAVRDSGIGISADACKRLFQPFSQADGSTTRRYGGSGLGLVIARQLVEMMGGTLDVSSEPGRGSEFWFTLPIQHAANASAVGPRAVETLDSCKILLADPCIYSRDAIQTLLIRHGAYVGASASMDDAIQQFDGDLESGRPFDVMLLDALVCGDLESSRRAGFTENLIKSGAKLIILIPLGSKLQNYQFEGLEVSATISKPVRRARMVAAIRGARRGGDEISVRPRPAGHDNDLAGPPRFACARILLAEDNHVNQKVASRSLERFGLRAEIVKNGIEAVDAAKRTRFDIIFMDCQMPEMDGFEATREIRKLDESSGAHTLIIALTANALAEDRSRCIEAGMDDYLSKPFRLDNLELLLKKYLQFSEH
ncbi:MAG: response regulator [Planctomycetes bacterium]|nr:response regulator [Planctomycetota bacterium]